MTSIKAVVEAQFAFTEDLKIDIPDQATSAVLTLFKHLVKKQPWECPSGHIVPKTPTWTSYSDTSK